MRVRENVIICRVIEFGEADLVVKALNRNGALLSLIARHARKSRRRFGGGVLEATQMVEVVYNRRDPLVGPEALHVLEEANLLESFTGLRQSYERLQTAMFFLQAVLYTSQPESQDDGRIFQLLAHGLKHLETSADPAKMSRLFFLKFLRLHGVLSPESPGYALTSRPLSAHGDIDFSGLDGSEAKALEEFLGHHAGLVSL